MGIKIHKKLLGLILAFVLLGVSFALSPPATNAAGSFGFSQKDIENFAAKPNFYFTDSSANTVEGKIHSSVQNKDVTVDFTSGASHNQTNFAYIYANSSKFCTPDPAKVPSQYSSYKGASTIGVVFTQLNNPIKAKVVTDWSGAYYGIWPGVSASNQTYPCGKASNPYVYPIAVSQDSLTTKNGGYTGNGSEFTKAVLSDKSHIKATFKSAGLISVQFPTGSPKNETVNFYDSDPDDNQFNFKTISSDNKLFCDPSQNATPGSGTGGQIDVSGTFTDSPLSGALKVNFVDSGTCQKIQTYFPITISNPSVKLKDGSTHRQAQLFATWEQDQIQITKCNSDGTCAPNSDWSLALVSGATTKYAKDPNSTCTGWTIDLTKAGGNYGTYYNSTGSGSCSKDDVRTVAIDGEKGTVPQPPPPPDGPAVSGLDCQTASATKSVPGYTLSFVICPMLDAAQSFSDWLIGQVENLLSFTFQHNLGNSTQRGNVENAWSQIRDLSSVFLVIIMLVMILSQAISYGPFDAYTIRKVMPRLVIAVIAMQLSWSLLEYVTRLFDAFGHGIADLMYHPFGGPSNLQLGKILQSAGIPAYAGGSVVLASLLAIGTIAVLSLPTILLIGWSIVMALLVAFVTLAVRQILIITMVILSPLAILLWILPNTQRYWKLWYDNFTKLLLMFPMIIGMIAAGRIFAYITSSGNNNTLIKFMLILIGYFGPFFMLPKTYKWGGAALSAAGGAIANAAPKVGGPVTNYLKGEQERSRWHLSREARKTELNRRAQQRWAEGLQMQGGLLSARGWRGRTSRLRTAGVRSAIPGLRPGDMRVRSSIEERAGKGLEEGMLKEIQAENIGDVNAYLAHGGNANAAVAAARARNPAMTAAEEERMRTNFGRYDTAGWRGNKVFAGQAVKQAGEAGFLDPTAVAAARAIYTDNGNDADAVARFSSIEDNAVRAAAKAGQIGVPGVGTRPADQAWRGVNNSADLGRDSIPVYMSQAGNTINGAFAAGAYHPTTNPDGGYTAASTYTAGTDPTGAPITYTGIRFRDAGLQSFVNEAARVRAGVREMPADKRAVFDQQYATMLDSVEAAHGPGARAAVEDLVSQKAARRHFGDG